MHPVGRPSRDSEFAEARLLVVDDDPVNVALLVAVLARAGYRNVVTEMDPRKVLTMLPDVDPDLVILDLHMPHLDGFAVLAQIRPRTDVELAVREGRISYEEAGRLLKFYEDGLQGYTYLEDPNER